MNLEIRILLKLDLPLKACWLQPLLDIATLVEEKAKVIAIVCQENRNNIPPKHV